MIEISSSTVSSTVDLLVHILPFTEGLQALFAQMDGWFKEQVGIDLYSALRLVGNFAVASTRLFLGLAGQAVDWIEGFLRQAD